jgi:hypothetical protein
MGFEESDGDRCGCWQGELRTTRERDGGVDVIPLPLRIRRRRTRRWEHTRFRATRQRAALRVAMRTPSCRVGKEAIQSNGRTCLMRCRYPSNGYNPNNYTIAIKNMLGLVRLFSLYMNWMELEKI